ncbi:aspartyl-phosphate phosphatase Spo0E family protein [Bacillus sp. ISL-55]|nr:aspartyl-phosphate phosphatase Spo0E family protein [Bacillus sp. ISL-55]
METVCLRKIMEEIELKRREMISSARETGFLSLQTISASQELDKLLNIIQEDQHIFSK